MRATPAKKPSRAPKPRPTGSPGTRDRLIEVAGAVFAGEGFRNATIRQICATAGVNIASVNYHFGGKVGLYREVFRVAAHSATAKYPITFDASGDAEAQLRQWCHMFIQRLLDPGRPAWHGKLIAREMVEPTAVLDEMVETWIRPQWTIMRRIVAANLGVPEDHEAVKRGVIGVLGQMLMQHHCRAVLERVLPEWGYSPQENQARAEFAAGFSIGALRSLRRALASEARG